MHALLEQIAAREVGRSSSPRRRPTQQRAQRNPQAYPLLGSNPLPDTFRVTPDHPGNVARSATRSRRRPRRRRARRSTPSIDEVKNRKRRDEKILSATRMVKLTMALLAVLLVLAACC